MSIRVAGRNPGDFLELPVAKINHKFVFYCASWVLSLSVGGVNDKMFSSFVSQRLENTD